MPRLIAMFGGTFDPVHNAHMRVALDVAEAGGLDEVRLIPCHFPPHRGQPAVASRQRLRMLELAAADEPCFVVDDRELRREAPSYTADTLLSLRADFPDSRLCLLLGTDSFRSLPRWHRWRELAELAHIVVMQRPEPGPAMPPDLVTWLRGRERESWAALRESANGCILFQKVTQLAISATDLRERLGGGGSGRYLMPEPVWSYIREEGLYGVASDGQAGRT